MRLQITKDGQLRKKHKARNHAEHLKPYQFKSGDPRQNPGGKPKLYQRFSMMLAEELAKDAPRPIARALGFKHQSCTKYQALIAAMIHEAMILEYSGRYLALIEWASAMKLFLFLTLLANIFFPWGVATTLQPGAVLIGFVALALKLSILAASLAVLETAVAKLRLFRVPELLSGSFMLALLAVISFFFLR